MFEEPLLTVNLCFLLLVLLAVKQPVLVSKTEGKSGKYFISVALFTLLLQMRQEMVQDKRKSPAEPPQKKDAVQPNQKKSPPLPPSTERKACEGTEG